MPEGDRIKVLGFDPDHLEDFTFGNHAKEFNSKRSPYFALGKPEFEFVIDLHLSEGVHLFDFPLAMQSINELIVIGSRPVPNTADHPGGGADEPAYVILALQPSAGMVHVLPQKWFTGRHFDLGYEWITRVTREPRSGRLIGDGIRIPAFELTEDGCNLKRWLSR